MKCPKCRKTVPAFPTAEEAVVFRGELWCRPCRDRTVTPMKDYGADEGRVVFVYDGEPYRFRNKAEARRRMRAVLGTQRLPSDVAALIRGDA